MIEGRRKVGLGVSVGLKVERTRLLVGVVQCNTITNGRYRSSRATRSLLLSRLLPFTQLWIGLVAVKKALTTMLQHL